MNLRIASMTLILLGVCYSQSGAAAAIAFQNPGNAAWGGWARGSAGSVYVHWDRFKNDPAIGAAPVLPDTTPDVAARGLGSNGAMLVTGKRNSTAAPAAFITGSNNIYSFSDILDFDVIVNPNKAHSGLGVTPVTVALQLSILGTDIAHNTVKLLGMAFDSRVTLSSGTASGPGGTGTGVDKEYRYLWHLDFAMEVYVFEFAAADTSLSLDAIAIDIGPGPAVGGGNDGGGSGSGTPIPTPLPGAWLLLAGAGACLARCRRVRVSSAAAR